MKKLKNTVKVIHKNTKMSLKGYVTMDRKKMWMFLLALVFVYVILAFYFLNRNKKYQEELSLFISIQQEMKVAYEIGFFIGQEKALHGDIRVTRLHNGNYIWNKTPHNDGSEPIFHPPLNNTVEENKSFSRKFCGNNIEKM